MKPYILFFSTNGAGLGHLTRCLAYARRLRDKAKISFFSLASATEYIEEMGFTADYFISHTWTTNTGHTWNTELSRRVGMLLEQVRPDVVVFDGTWPFQGFLAACKAYGPLKLVWSNRSLFKNKIREKPTSSNLFELIIQPGELGSILQEDCNEKKIVVPPVTLLKDDELFSREDARRALNLPLHGYYALLSLGAGNINNISEISKKLLRNMQISKYNVIWACAPISIRDVELPPNVLPVSVYPLVRYHKAFDIFVGAAGYNTCCEVVQTQIPALLFPNANSADDQACRAHMVTEHAPAVVCAGETEAEIDAAVAQVLAVAAKQSTDKKRLCPLPMNGADIAAEAILKLALERSFS